MQLFRRMVCLVLVVVLTAGLLPPVDVRAEETDSSGSVIQPTQKPEEMTAPTEGTSATTGETQCTLPAETAPETTESEDTVPEDTEPDTTLPDETEPEAILCTPEQLGLDLAQIPYPGEEGSQWVIFRGAPEGGICLAVFILPTEEAGKIRLVWNQGILMLAGGSPVTGCTRYCLEENVWQQEERVPASLEVEVMQIIAAGMDVYDAEGELLCQASVYPAGTLPEREAAAGTTGGKQLTSVVVKQSNGYGHEYRMTYNDQGYLTSVSYGENGDYHVEMELKYDSAGRLTEVWNPQIPWLDTPSRTYTYNEAGQLTEYTHTEGSSSTSQYTYAPDGKLQRIDVTYDTGTEIITFTYNAQGVRTGAQRITEYQDGTSYTDNTTYTYDQQGRVISASGTSYGQEFQTIWRYDLSPFVVTSYQDGSSSVFLQDVYGHEIWSMRDLHQPQWETDADGYLTRAMGTSWNEIGLEVEFLYDHDTPDTPELTGWQKAYYDFIIADRATEQYGNPEYVHYELLYLDDDPVPELWITYSSSAGGCRLLSWSDGVLLNKQMAYGTLHYIRNTGIFSHFWARMGVCVDTVFSLKDGVLQQEALGQYTCYDSNGEFVGEITGWSWDDRAVTEEGYAEALNAWVDQELAAANGISTVYTYTEILAKLNEPLQYHLEITPRLPVICTGTQQEVVFTLYCNEQPVMDWEPEALSTSNLTYRKGYSVDGGYGVLVEGGSIGIGAITLKCNDALSMTAPVRVISDVEPEEGARRRWIEDHMEYARSDDYTQEIVPGYSGRMNGVFGEVIDDNGIKFYDFTEHLTEFNFHPSQKDLYELLLAELLFNSLNEDFLYEIHMTNVSNAMANVASAFVEGASTVMDVDPKIIDSITETVELFQTTSPGTEAFGQVAKRFIGQVKTNFTSEQFADALEIGLLMAGLTVTINGIDLYNSSQEDIYIFVYNSLAYASTSDDVVRVLDEMERKLLLEFPEGSFPEMEAYDDAVNWNDLAMALRSISNTIEACKESRGAAIARYAIEAENAAAELFLSKTGKTIAETGVLAILSCIPVLNVVGKAYSILKAGNLCMELFTGVDERAFCLDMLTKLYCISVLLDSVADEFAGQLREDCFWTASAFDEAITMYKSAQAMAADYMITYETLLLEEAYQDKITSQIILGLDPIVRAEIIGQFEQAIHWYSNAIRILQEQKKDIWGIFCHDPWIRYNSVTDEIIEYYDNSNIYIVACPTELTVTDEKGNVVALLSNGECQVQKGHELYYHTVSLNDTESMKIAVVPDQYHLKVAGTDTGAMDVFAGRLDAENDTFSSYLNVPIQPDSRIRLENDEKDPDRIVLTVDQVEYKPDTSAVIASGEWGSNIRWSLEAGGTLTLSGTGKMDGFHTETNDEGLLVAVNNPWSAYTGRIKKVVIGEGIESVGNFVFMNHTALHQVQLPKSLKHIGNRGFSGCTALKKIAIPDGVETFGADVFSGSGLTEITLPDSVQSLGVYMFAGCTDLKKVTLGRGVGVLPTGIFRDSGLTEAAGMDSVWQIAEKAFEQCVFLKSITMKNVSTIGSRAFGDCDALEEIRFTDTVPNIESDAFANVTATAYYNGHNRNWQSWHKVNYGGRITWASVFDTQEVYGLHTDRRALLAGDSAVLTAELFPQEGDNQILWSLLPGDETYATLTADGRSATVTAKPVEQMQKVTVTACTVSGYLPKQVIVLTIVPEAEKVYLMYGGRDVTQQSIVVDLNDPAETTLQLSAKMLPEGAARSIAWESSNEEIAAVDPEGKVTFTGTTGTVTITAQVCDNQKASAGVTIRTTRVPHDLEKAHQAQTPGAPDMMLLAGKSAVLKVYDAATGNTLKSSQIRWTLDEKYAPYAKITPAGKLTAGKVAGSVRIQAVGTMVDNPRVTVTFEVQICPAVTQVEMCYDGADAAGTVIFDLAQTGEKTVQAAVYPVDSMNVPVKWTISDKKNDYASYEIRGNTVIIRQPTGKEGTVTFKAVSQDGSKKSASLKVTFVTASRKVEILTTRNTLTAGQTLQLQAAVKPENATEKDVTWRLKNPEDKQWVSLSASGKMKAKTVPGSRDVTVIATAEDGCAWAEYTVTLLPKDTGMLILKHSGENVTGSEIPVDVRHQPKLQLRAEYFDTGSAANVVWSSSDTDVATVDSGLVTVLGTGKTVIQVRTPDGKKARVTLKTSCLAQKVEIPETAPVVASGKSVKLSAKVTGADNSAVLWTVISGAEFATVSKSGKLTAVKGLTKVKTVTVRATAADGSGKYADVSVSIHPVAQGVEISSTQSGGTVLQVRSTDSWRVRSNTTLQWNMDGEEQLVLTARVYPWHTQHSELCAIQKVRWDSSSEKVATVSQDGHVTYRNPGTTTITATADDGSGKKVSFRLKVEKYPTKLSLEDQVIAGGKRLNLEQLVKTIPADATTGQLTWKITGGDAEAWAELSRNGVLKTRKVTAPKMLTIQVTEANSGCTAMCRIWIYPEAVSKVSIVQGDIEVTGKTMSMATGQRLLLGSRLLPQTAGQAVHWSSSNPDVARVDEKTGTVTALKNGKATVTCMAADGSRRKTAVKIRVEDLDSQDIASLEICRTYALDEPMTIRNMNARVVLKDGTQRNIVSGLTVNKTRFDRAGTHQITVRYAGISRTIPVEVLDFTELSLELVNRGGLDYNTDNRVYWMLDITGSYTGNPVSAAYTDTIPKMYFEPTDDYYLWYSAAKGVGSEWGYVDIGDSYGDHSIRRTIALPDDPSLAGRHKAELTFGDMTKTVTFELVYRGSYRTSSGWKVTWIHW